MTTATTVKHAKVELKKVGNRVACFPACQQTKFLAAMDNAFLSSKAATLGGEISDASLVCLINEGYIIQFNDQALAKQVVARITE